MLQACEEASTAANITESHRKPGIYGAQRAFNLNRSSCCGPPENSLLFWLNWLWGGFPVYLSVSLWRDVNFTGSNLIAAVRDVQPFQVACHSLTDAAR